MKITVGSAIRNAETYLDTYDAQITALASAGGPLGYHFDLIVAEGDSTDGTWERSKHLFGNRVFKREHGGPLFGSVDNEVRWRQSSWVWDGILERVPADADVFLYIEADLVWKPTVILQLIEHLKRPEVDVVVPMCWSPEGIEYDVWGKRGMDGTYFGANFPYHPSLLDRRLSDLCPIASAGSCLVMRGGVARRCRFVSPNQGIISFCADIRSKGYRIWLDQNLGVEHP